MCGIAGCINFGGKPVEPADMSKMLATIAHRGPDGEGTWVLGSVGLGHRRLAIRDLSEGGRQPIADAESGLVVTYNGEIYNEQALRSEIGRSSSYRFHTSCDAELIAPAYALWGKDAFLKFEGMYAVAIWDRSAERLIIARDPIGIKPVFYSVVGDSIHFASEIKALLALDDQPRALSPENLHRFLAQGFPGPERTLIETIHPLPPGSILTADRNGVRVERFWRPRRSGRITNLGEAVARFDELWPEVVKDHLISDVPVGLLLSGGIDSALVATELKERPDIGAYTADFGHENFNEGGLANLSVERTRMRHNLVPIDMSGSDLAARFADVVAKSDGQLADSSSLAFHALCQTARGEVPVLLTGDGADEFFGGYDTYRATRLAGQIGNLVPGSLGRVLGQAMFWGGDVNGGRVGKTEKIARFLAGIGHGGRRTHPQWRRYLYPEVSKHLYGEAMCAVAAADPLLDYAAAIKHGGDIDSALEGDQAYYLPSDLLVKSDSMSMAHGVEVRVPFLDRRMMEFANDIHVNLLVPRNGPNKNVLRSALAARGLPSNLTRASKKGFNIPMAAYLRDGLRPLGARNLDADADILSPYLKPDAVRAIWRGHLAGQTRHSYVLWTLLTLATWRAQAGI